MVATLSRREVNALRWFTNNGYVPVVGGMSNRQALEFTNKVNDTLEIWDIDQILQNYTDDQISSARRKAAEKRGKSNKGGIYEPGSYGYFRGHRQG